MKTIPVILQTDIGTDIDDTWALAMLLKLPVFQLKMILTDTQDTVYRAKICAKMLEGTPFADTVEIGSGIPGPIKKWVSTLADWVSGYDLASCRHFHEDGIDCMIRVIRESAEPVTLISIGPCGSIAEALNRAPDIAEKCRFVGMFGCIRTGVGGKAPHPEYNVVCDIPAFQKVLHAPWRGVCITPQDTCGQVQLKGSLYQKIADSSDPMLRKVLEQYEVWRGVVQKKEADESSILFDTVAVHLAYSEEFLEMEELPWHIREDGFSVVDPYKGKMVRTAIRWKDLDAYQKYLTNVLTGK